MKEVLRTLNQRPVAYYPINAKLMGSVTGGIALSQILYWLTAGKKPPTKIKAQQNGKSQQMAKPFAYQDANPNKMAKP